MLIVLRDFVVEGARIPLEPFPRVHGLTKLPFAIAFLCYIVLGISYAEINLFSLASWFPLCYSLRVSSYPAVPRLSTRISSCYDTICALP